MDYLTRPVFEFAIDWADPVNKAFSFDLRETPIGFGAEVFQSLQQYVVQGYQIVVDLNTDWATGSSQIQEFDDFTAALTGRLKGFWLPAPFEGMEITAGIAGQPQFDIKRQRLAETWRDNPDVHLWFERDAYSSQPAKIINVVDLGTGFERVTIGAVLTDNDQMLSPGSRVKRLHYVRLAEDVESGRFEAEGWQRRSVRVVELPQEYALAETGELPVYLYHFWLNAPMDVHWYYTSFAANVISGNNEYLAKPGINHGAHRRSVRIEAETIDIEWVWADDHALALFVPLPFPRPMNVEVLEADYAIPDTTKKIFVGQVRAVPDRGDQLVAQCDSFGVILKRKMPRMYIQKECNFQVYEPRTCKAVQAFFEEPATIISSNALVYPPTVTIRLKFPEAAHVVADYFAQGWIETGQQKRYELRSVIGSTGSVDVVTLTLNAPLRHATAGQSLVAVPGCDGQAATCDTKFDNFINFGGFPAVPDKNLSLKAVENRVSAGDKK
jgi:uncharacterized phage protein (TIGR02218 family)